MLLCTLIQKPAVVDKIFLRVKKKPKLVGSALKQNWKIYSSSCVFFSENETWNPLITRNAKIKRSNVMWNRSISRISNCTNAFNYYASTAHESNWLKSSSKVRLRKDKYFWSNTLIPHNAGTIKFAKFQLISLSHFVIIKTFKNCKFWAVFSQATLPSSAKIAGAQFIYGLFISLNLKFLAYMVLKFFT